MKSTTKTPRINWTQIDTPTRIRLQKLAAKMKRKGFTRIQLNYHGCDMWSIDGFNSVGGHWIG